MAIESKTQSSIALSLNSFFATIQTAITDFNTGSIITNIFNAVALAISGLYAQLENFYNASFVSTATGQDLDNRVADFFLTREIATNSTVTETFFETTFNPSPVLITAGSIIATSPAVTGIQVQFQIIVTTIFNPVVTGYEIEFFTGIYTYALGNRQVSSIVQATGTVSGNPYTFVQGSVGVGDYYLDTSNPEQNNIIFNTPGVGRKNPDPDTIVSINYNALSIDVVCQSLLAGAAYNVAPLTATILQNAIPGINGATNFDAATGGTDTETDAHLRQRVIQFLQSLARATVPSLISQSDSVSGVISTSVTEPNPPQGYVIVVPDDGTGNASPALQTAVFNAISGTQASNAYRAAGIITVIRAPLITLITINASVFTLVGVTQSSVLAGALANLNIYFNTLTVNSTVLRAQIICAILTVTGVTDVDLSNLYIATNNLPPVGGLSGDIPVPPGYTPRLGTVTITIEGTNTP